MPIRMRMGAGIVAAAIVAGFVWWMVALGQDVHLGKIGAGLFQSASLLFALVCCLRYSRFFAGITTPNAWLYYAFGTFLFLSAKLYTTFSLLFYNELPQFPGFSELLIASQFLLYMGALRHHFADRDSRIPLIRFYLDLWIFTVSLVSLYWYYFLEPGLALPFYRDSNLLLSFIGSTFSAAMLIGLTSLCISGRATEHKGVLVLLMATFGLKTGACLMQMHLSAGVGGPWLSFTSELGLVVCFLLLGFAAVMKEGERGYLFAAREPAGKRPAFVRMLPGLIIGSVLLAFTLGVRHPDALVVGTVLVIYLLLVRLWISKREFKYAERALSDAERKYRNLVENSQVGVFSAQYGKLTYVNRYFADTFDYEPEEMVSTSFMHYFSGEDREKLAMEITRLAMNHGYTPHIGVRGIKRDGSSVHLEVQVTRTVNHGDVIITGTLLDITERKMAEDMVIRSEKLSVVGQLAAGVAHEIRNPLTSLRGFTQLLRTRAGDGQNSEFYDIMLNELDRINYIVGEFMLLSKPQQMQQLEQHDMRELMSGLLPIIETQAIIHNVTINMDWKTPIYPVLCDKNQIKQVFMNILKNAIESMTGGGTIRIRFSSHGEEYVGVQIVDEGPGMPADVLSRLGEPFFTTKKTGTGLGLMVCYRIIEAHNGKMIINSEKGKGTSVEIQLRMVRKDWSMAIHI